MGTPGGSCGWPGANKAVWERGLRIAAVGQVPGSKMGRAAGSEEPNQPEAQLQPDSTKRPITAAQPARFAPGDSRRIAGGPLRAPEFKSAIRLPIRACCEFRRRRV